MRLLAYHGLVAAFESCSWVWSRGLPRSKRSRGGLYGTMVLALLEFLARAQHT